MSLCCIHTTPNYHDNNNHGCNYWLVHVDLTVYNQPNCWLYDNRFMSYFEYKNFNNLFFVSTSDQYFVATSDQYFVALNIECMS